jgi:hypothetical protein
MLSTLYRKNKIELKFHQKEKNLKKSEEKQRKKKEKKAGGKKNGVQGGVPFALQIQTFQKKERIKGLATKGKITRKKKRESRECPLTILPIVVLQITNSTSMPR